MRDMMYKQLLCCLAAAMYFAACNTPNTGKNDNQRHDLNTVTVHFFNESSFKVDIYRNVNPSPTDTSAKPLVTVNAGSTEKVKLPPSTDQTIGDVFYLRYNVQLADAFTSGTGKPLYVQAKRDIANIAFVLKADRSYTKTIKQPEQLNFIHCYIKVQNTGAKSFQVLQGSTYLKKLGTEELNLASGQFGFYELNISDLETSETMKTLKFFVTDSISTITVAPFLLERGKIYSFQYNGTTVTAPAVTDIAY